MNDDHHIELSHDQVSQALQALFVEQDQRGAFEEVSAQQVHRHLAGCEACRRQYDALALCDRALSDDGAQAVAPTDGAQAVDPSTLARAGFETSFGEASFMGALDEMLAGEAGVRGSRGPGVQGSEGPGARVVDLADKRGALGPMTRWLSAAAAALLVGAGSWLAWQHLHQSPQHSVRAQDPGQFQARSAASTTNHGPFAQPKLEIFCAQKAAEGVRFHSAKDAPFGLLKCPVDAEIKLAYANPSPKLHYAAFFGVDQTGNHLLVRAYPGRRRRRRGLHEQRASSGGAVDPAAGQSPAGRDARLRAVRRRPHRLYQAPETDRRAGQGHAVRRRTPRRPADSRRVYQQHL